MVGGSIYSRMNVLEGETVFNDESIDVDFRVESNGNANMLFVDGGNDKVGIGVAAPTARLSLPAQASGDSGVARFAIESATDDNDFTISQYEDGTGTYTLVGQNINLNSAGNVTVLDTAHKTAGVLFDGRGNGQVEIYTGAANASSSKMTIDSAGHVTMPLQSSFHVIIVTGSNQTGFDAVTQNTVVVYNHVVHDTNSDFNTSTCKNTAPVF